MRDNLPNLRGPAVSERVNEVYKTYCSMYLDFYDDNFGHLYDRQNDTYPIDKIGHNPTEQELYDTYKKECIDFAAIVLSDYSEDERGQKFQEWFEKDYPLINEWKEDIDNAVAKIKGEKYTGDVFTVRVYDRENGEGDYIENSTFCKQFSSEEDAESYVKKLVFSQLCESDDRSDWYDNGCSLTVGLDGEDKQSLNAQFVVNGFPEFHDTRYSVYSDSGQKVPVDWSEIIEWANSPDWLTSAPDFIKGTSTTQANRVVKRSGCRKANTSSENQREDTVDADLGLDASNEGLDNQSKGFGEE